MCIGGNVLVILFFIGGYLIMHSLCFNTPNTLKVVNVFIAAGHVANNVRPEKKFRQHTPK